MTGPAGLPLAPLRRTKMADIIADQLRALIATGEVGPRGHLPRESELAARFDVSVATVRQALRIPEAESLVSIRAGARAGAALRDITGATLARQAGIVLQLRGAALADVLAARLIVEPPAAGLAAVSCTAADLAALEELIATGQTDPDTAATGAEFHRRVLSLSGNQTLVLIGEMLSEVFVLHNRATIEQRVRSSRTWARGTSTLSASIGG
jgi:GntR family transcriptional regulator, transcriptional repressor for pyruvate dehydrogenase complex